MNDDELAAIAARAKLTLVEGTLGRVLINQQPNADLDAPPNVRYWG